MERWRGKVALVTGASAGIGAAIAVALAKNGMRVVGVARRPQLIENLKKAVKGPGELHALKCDVSREDDVLATFQWIESRFGTVHVLINNAGVFRPGKLIDQDPKRFREVMNTNVIGLSLCSQQALQLMKKSQVDYGHIININSVCGHQLPMLRDGPTGGIYPASKHAVTAITEIMRQELHFSKSSIKVTSLSPGIVATEINEAAMKVVGRAAADLSQSMKNEPALEAKDIADAAVYILSTPPHVVVKELIIKPLGEAF